MRPFFALQSAGVASSEDCKIRGARALFVCSAATFRCYPQPHLSVRRERKSGVIPLAKKLRFSIIRPKNL